MRSRRVKYRKDTGDRTRIDRSMQPRASLCWPTLLQPFGEGAPRGERRVPSGRAAVIRRADIEPNKPHGTSTRSSGTIEPP